MTVEDACSFFENHPRINRYVRCLQEVGLDYIQLGQPSTQLSGGEAQRVKLATELGKSAGPLPMPRRRPSDAEVVEEEAEPDPQKAPGSSSTLYILDEPTTGLHFEDIHKLCTVFDRLADAGNTLVVIEHNLDVIKRADWIIDLGPEGGDRGGIIVAQGPPEKVALVKESHTGHYLKPMLTAAR
jgi:excinuclease ABC subunit A